MNPPVPKHRVREAFDRAASSYDAAAVVQRTVCDRLLAELASACEGSASAPRTILDAGCGTGYGSRQLRARWPQARIDAVDFAPAMLGLARHDAEACCAADIEALPFAADSFDLWWSSLSIQWCDATTVFREAARVLEPGGRIAVSTLGPQTFHELRSAFSGVDHHRHTLEFSEPGPIGAALAAAGFHDIRLVREMHALHYPDLKTLLRSVKAIGAHNVGEGGRTGMMGRDAWLRVQAAYESFRVAGGLPASYDVILATATL